MSSTLKSKRILLERCFHALLISVGMQFLLLGVFLLLINFDILHILNWIMKSVRLVCSWYTWFSIIPLIYAVIFYGVILARLHLAEKRYHPTRFNWLIQCAAQKLLLIVAHVLVGFLTGWLYVSYLHSNYRNIKYDCYEQQCINPNYIFLMSIAIFAGCYNFVKSHLHDNTMAEYPVVQQTRLIEFRILLNSTLSKSLKKSLLPTISFTLVYWLFEMIVIKIIIRLFAADYDKRFNDFYNTSFNWRLLFYAWILTSQIMSNMHLMLRLFSLYLSEDLPLVINVNPVYINSDQITLLDALKVSKIFLVQCLAAKYFYQISVKHISPERQEIFRLKEPGNYPVTWNELSNQCINMIVGFTDELANSIKSLSVNEDTRIQQTTANLSSKVAAEKILLRQYNHMHGMRPITVSSENFLIWKDNGYKIPALTTTTTTISKRINAKCEQFTKYIHETIRYYIRQMPGIDYMFSESDKGKVNFLLEKSILIAWLLQALAETCAASLKEDQFGVVQPNLQQIIKSALNLRIELGKLENINVDSRRSMRNIYILTNATNRSIYTICNAFGEHVLGTTTDPEELRLLHNFLNYFE